jgi:hypothetical protein
MSKAWSMVVIAWLAAASLATAQPAPDSAGGATQAAPGLPPNFHPATPYCAPEPPPPCPCPTSPLVTGIICPECPPVVWGRYDELFWWVRPGPNPNALVTTSNLTAVPPIIPGALNDPNARVLVGQAAINFGMFNGGRVTAGMWLNFERSVGIEASGFLLESRSANQAVNSDANGNPLLAQPFFDPNRMIENVNSLAIPNIQAGSFTLAARSRTGAGEGNFLFPLQDWGGLHLIGTVGFHYLNLDESLVLNTNTGIIQSFAGIFPLFFQGVQNVDFPRTLTFRDSFRTSNQFYGGQAGARWEWEFWDQFQLQVEGEVALGVMQNQLEINGFTIVNATANGPVIASAPGGFYAQRSNIGRFSRSTFSALPTGDIQLHYELFPNCWIHLGYTVLFATGTVRPGQQIDRTINTSQAPGLADFGLFPNGPARPTVNFQDTTFWAHGIDVGIKLTY